MLVSILHDITGFRRFPRDAKLLIISSIVMSFTQGYMFVDFSIYLSQVGYSTYWIGIVLSVPTFLGALFMIPMGHLSDMYGRKRFILLARFFSFLGAVIYFLTYNLILVILAGIFQGIAFANASSSYNALMAEKTTSEDRNLIFASNSFLSGMAQAAGMFYGSIPPIIGHIYHIDVFTSYRVLFLTSIIGLLISTLLIIKVKEEYRGNRGESFSFRDLFNLPEKSRGVIIKLSVLGMIGLGAGMIVRLFSLWFYLKFHVNVDVLGPIFSISQIVTAFATITTPSLARKIGEIRTIVFTEALSVLILISMPFLPFYYLAGVFLIIRNFLMNMSGPIMTSFTMSIIPVEERARGSAIIQFFDALPRSFGPYIGGFFMSLGYIDLPFFFTGTLYSLSIGLFYLFFRNVKIPR
ncbi:MAG: MFS transporter [Thermoplasmata archaeon]